MFLLVSIVNVLHSQVRQIQAKMYTSHGSMYCPHHFGKISITSKQ